MELLHSVQDHVLIIIPKGEAFDSRDAFDFKDKGLTLIVKNDLEKVILDLTHLHFIDSFWLGSFLSLLRILNARGITLKLSRVNESIRTLFELTSIHKKFEIFETTEEAIHSFSHHKPPDNVLK